MPKLEHSLTVWLRKLLGVIFVPFVALALLFEEWGWKPLAAAVAWIARLPILREIEAWITRLPPWPALCILVVPAAALLPVKLLALLLFGRGHVASGITLLVLAKIAGTALVARLFMLTQPALMQLGWFARWYPRWKNWKDDLLARIRTSAPWQAAGRFRRALRARVSAWWAR